MKFYICLSVDKLQIENAISVFAFLRELQQSIWHLGKYVHKKL